MADYISVEKQSTSEIVEKKSRFICNMKHVESEDEAVEFIKQMRKKYGQETQTIRDRIESELAVIEKPAKVEGRNIIMILAPKNAKK